MEKYKFVNGTAYHKETKPEVIAILERARAGNLRLAIEYGDAVTGQRWGDGGNKAVGYVGRSTGKIKIPLVIVRENCMGGEALLDHCIVSIRYSNKKVGGVLYSMKEAA